MKLGVLTGLAREVDCLPRNHDQLIVSCSGSNPERAEILARQMVEQGCGALLSFGVAGALSPNLCVGDTVVSEGVVDSAGVRFPVAQNWRTRVIEGLPRANQQIKSGWIFGSDEIVSRADGKARLYASTQALCVDMETHRMARIAEANRIPFLAIRVISDDARDDLPSVALGVIGENGEPKILKVISRLARKPHQLPKLLKLSRDMETAVSELRRVTGLIGPLFRFA